MDAMIELLDALITIVHRILEPFSTDFDDACDLVQHIYCGEYGDRDVLIAAMCAAVEQETNREVVACFIEIATACKMREIQESVAKRRKQKPMPDVLRRAIDEYLTTIGAELLLRTT